jgi:SAM-dependent methyltransferase
LREQRIKQSDAELDQQEMDWWNTNAATIEKIWALNLELQKIIRRPYLKRMKRFFTADATHKPVKILEIGCGSGWVCRMVANEDFNVIGTDFSASQLAIAREQARFYQKEKFCRYELADASSFNKNIDGVVIHALLHHLSTHELTTFFGQLAKIPTGTKVFMYEPVFMNRHEGKPSWQDKMLNKIITKLKFFSINRARSIGEPDRELSKAMENIFEDAKNYGWYISPKEVPFYQAELHAYLEPFFTIQKEYLVNKTDLAIAQELILNKVDRPGFLFSKVLIPLSAWLDKLAFKGKFTFYISPWEHQFVCFELIKK